MDYCVRYIQTVKQYRDKQQFHLNHLSTIYLYIKALDKNKIVLPPVAFLDAWKVQLNFHISLLDLNGVMAQYLQEKLKSLALRRHRLTIEHKPALPVLCLSTNATSISPQLEGTVARSWAAPARSGGTTHPLQLSSHHRSCLPCLSLPFKQGKMSIRVSSI